MIMATFRYKDSGLVDMLAFPQVPHGLCRDRKRPYRVEFKGTYNDEPTERLQIWMRAHCYKALTPNNQEVAVNIKDLPFDGEYFEQKAP